jgi:hypothetical protein
MRARFGLKQSLGFHFTGVFLGVHTVDGDHPFSRFDTLKNYQYSAFPSNCYQTPSSSFPDQILDLRVNGRQQRG